MNETEELIYNLTKALQIVNDSVASQAQQLLSLTLTLDVHQVAICTLAATHSDQEVALGVLRSAARTLVDRLASDETSDQVRQMPAQFLDKIVMALQKQDAETPAATISPYAALSTLALQLALKNGEAVTRPLSQAQLARAVQIHLEESEMLRQLLVEHAKVLAAQAAE